MKKMYLICGALEHGESMEKYKAMILGRMSMEKYKAMHSFMSTVVRLGLGSMEDFDESVQEAHMNYNIYYNSPSSMADMYEG